MSDIIKNILVGLADRVEAISPVPPDLLVTARNIAEYGDRRCGFDGYLWGVIDGASHAIWLAVNFQDAMPGDLNAIIEDFVAEYLVEKAEDKALDFPTSKLYNKLKELETNKVTFIVDMPNPHAGPGRAWVEVGQFNTREEAVKWITENVCPTTDGTIQLITEVQND